MHTPIKIIIGLGNEYPLARNTSHYHGTRHNVGSDIVYFLSSELHIPFTITNDKKVFEYKHCKFMVVKSFMNNIGIQIAHILKQLNINPNELLVIHDEIEIKCGLLKWRIGGSHNGHNGLRSIIQSLGTKDFYRLRVGIDRVSSEHLSEYVLSKPSLEQKKLIDQCMDYISKNLDMIMQGQFQQIEFKGDIIL